MVSEGECVESVVCGGVLETLCFTQVFFEIFADTNDNSVNCKKMVSGRSSDQGGRVKISYSYANVFLSGLLRATCSS